MINNIINQLARQIALPLGGAICLVCLMACSSDLPEVYPVKNDEITMSISQGISSRASDGYRDWSADIDPTQMGVIAFTNAGSPASPDIFNNVLFSAPQTQGGTIWTTAEDYRKHWSDYGSATSFDFFAYMPYMTGVTLTKSDDTYVLTIPGVPGISTKPYLVATLPKHYANNQETDPVPLQFDQLMTAFEFRFKLGPDMSTLRTFKITKIKMTGGGINVPTTATIKQFYTLTSPGGWTKGITETIDPTGSQTSVELTSSAEIGYRPNPTDYVSAGTIYLLPFHLSGESPIIEVTYDVYDQDGYKTRTQTSTIKLTDTGVTGSLATAIAGHKNILRVSIVPSSLKVLSDADQSVSGYLVVE